MRCLIVDDSQGFIDAARSLLECQGITVVGTASTVAGALRRYLELRPQVVLVDVDLGGESGFDVAELLHEFGATAPVILISTHAGDDFIEMIAASPAVGFIAKSGLTGSAILEQVCRSARLKKGDSG